jgi:RimJ/RimL family protein N-acetyltransferase
VILYGQNGELSGENAVPNEILVNWISARLGIKDFGPCTTIGVSHKGEIVAVALYNKYLPPNIEVSFCVSSPKWASPGAVHKILRYPFQQLNCKRITATTEATNQRARAFLCRLGFKQEGYHREVFPNGDAITYGLLRRECRWLSEEFNEQSSSTGRT